VNAHDTECDLERAMECRDLAFMGTVPSGHPVIYAGFSQGCLIACTCALSFEAAGLLLFSASPLWRTSPLWRAKPDVLQCHGVADKMVAPHFADAVHKELVKHGCDAKLSVHDGVGHHVSESMLQEARPWLLERLPALSCATQQEEDEDNKENVVANCASPRMDCLDLGNESIKEASSKGLRSRWSWTEVEAIPLASTAPTMGLGTEQNPKGAMYMVMAFEVHIYATSTGGRPVSTMSQGSVLELFGWDSTWQRRQTHGGWVELDNFDATPPTPLLRPVGALASNSPMRPILTMIHENDVRSLERYMREQDGQMKAMEPDCCGITPLHVAESLHHLDCIIVLVKGGADPVEMRAAACYFPLTRNYACPIDSKELLTEAISGRAQEQHKTTDALMEALKGVASVQLPYLDAALQQLQPRLLIDAIQILQEYASPSVADHVWVTNLALA